MMARHGRVVQNKFSTHLISTNHVNQHITDRNLAQGDMTYLIKNEEEMICFDQEYLMDRSTNDINALLNTSGRNIKRK